MKREKELSMVAVLLVFVLFLSSGSGFVFAGNTDDSTESLITKNLSTGEEIFEFAERSQLSDGADLDAVVSSEGASSSSSGSIIGSLSAYGAVLDNSDSDDSKEKIVTKNLLTGDVETKTILDYVSGSNISPSISAISVNGGSSAASATFKQPALTRDIIGSDDRVAVTDTSNIPNSAIAYIEIDWPNGDATDGTAFMYWSDIALTSGHNIYNAERGGWALSVTVWPGRIGSSTPYGSAYAAYMSTSTEWADHSNMNYDYGILTLNKDMTCGYFGALWHTNDFFSGNYTIAGYGGIGTNPVTMTSTITNMATPNLIFHEIDTDVGQSGSPVFNSSNQIIGIHSGTFSPDRTNRATRITESLFNMIQSLRV